MMFFLIFCLLGLYFVAYADHFRTDVIAGVALPHHDQYIGQYHRVLQTLHRGPQTVHHDPGMRAQPLLVQYQLSVSLRVGHILEQSLQVLVLLEQP